MSKIAIEIDNILTLTCQVKPKMISTLFWEKNGSKYMMRRKNIRKSPSYRATFEGKKYANACTSAPLILSNQLTRSMSASGLDPRNDQVRWSCESTAIEDFYCCVAADVNKKTSAWRGSCRRIIKPNMCAWIRSCLLYHAIWHWRDDESGRQKWMRCFFFFLSSRGCPKRETDDCDNRQWYFWTSWTPKHGAWRYCVSIIIVIILLSETIKKERPKCPQWKGTSSTISRAEIDEYHNFFLSKQLNITRKNCNIAAWSFFRAFDRKLRKITFFRINIVFRLCVIILIPTILCMPQNSSNTDVPT